MGKSDFTPAEGRCRGRRTHGNKWRLSDLLDKVVQCRHPNADMVQPAARPRRFHHRRRRLAWGQELNAKIRLTRMGQKLNVDLLLGIENFRPIESKAQ